jgi:signal transduction histidine kinase
VTEAKELPDKRIEDLRNLIQRMEIASAERDMSLHHDLHKINGQLSLALGSLQSHAAEQPAEAANGIQQAMNELRAGEDKIFNGLVLKLGISPALSSLIDGFTEKTGIPSEFACLTKERIALPLFRSVRLFRLIEDFLSQLSEHANCTNVILELDKVDGQVQVQVTYEGQQILPHEHKPAPGHLSIADQCFLLGDKFETETLTAQPPSFVLKVFV